MPKLNAPLRTVSGAEISRVGLGCSRVGSFGNTTPMAEIRATLNGALDAGVNLFDTANIYGQGDSEREIGRAVRARRAEAFVITKAGKSFSGRMKLLRPLKPLLRPLLGARATQNRAASITRDYDPARLREDVEASLGRLGFDYVDGLMLHSPPASALARPDLEPAAQALIDAGKIRYFGVSCDDYPAMRVAAALPVVRLLQVPLDVLEQAEADGLMAELAARGVHVFAREVIVHQPGVPPREAVARAARRPGVASVIAGTSKLRHLADLADAVAPVPAAD